MPTARQLAKKQKQFVSEHFDCESATFEALADPDFPVQLVSENLLRSLSYEGDKGLAEFVALFVLSAGCSSGIQFELYTPPNWQKSVNSLVSACLISPSGCPAEFVGQKPAFQKRFNEVLQTVCSALIQTRNLTVLNACADFVAELAELKLQSLRYLAVLAANAFLTTYLDLNPLNVDFTQTEQESQSEVQSEDQSETSEASGSENEDEIDDEMDDEMDDGTSQSPNEEDEEKGSEDSDSKDGEDNEEAMLSAFSRKMNQCVLERRFDAAVPIRKLCVPSITSEDVSEAFVWLNDLNPQVRLSFLRALLVNSSIELTEEQIDRLRTSAKLDSDMAVRRACLRVVLKKKVGLGSIDLVFDSDTISRNLAAECFVASMLEKHSISKALLDSVDAIALVEHEQMKEKYTELETKPATAAIARAFDKHKPGAADAVLQLLVKRRGRPLKKSQTALLLDVLQSAKPIALPVQRLLEVFKHDDKLLAKVLVTVSLQPVDEQCLDSVKELFLDRSSYSVLAGCQKVFQQVSSTRHEVLEQLYHDLRVRVASILGPTGARYQEHQEEVDNLFTKIVILAPLVDLSDILRLPVYECLTQTSSANLIVLQLLRAVALTSNELIVKQILEHLSPYDEPEYVNTILQIHTASKLRGLDVGPVSEYKSVPDESVYVAAVAARVI